MADKHPSQTGLNELLSTSPAAKAYFMSLPEDAQGTILQHSDRVHSLEDLRSYADSLSYGG